MVQFHASGLSRQSSTISHRSLLRRYWPNTTWITFALVATTFWLPSQSFSATTLDQAITNRLSNQCTGLVGGTGTGGASTPGFGANLDDICTSVPNDTGGSVGGGTGTAQSLGATVENRRNDRLEGKQTGNQAALNLPSGLGLYISGNLEALDRERTSFSDGFDSSVWGATAGADFRFSDRFLAGAAFNYVDRDGDFDGGGDFTTDSYGVLAYASFMPTPAMFLDISLGYTKHDYEVDRPVLWAIQASDPNSTTFTGRSDSESDGHEFSINAVTGYDYTIGIFTIGPRVGVNYSRLRIDDYSENGGGGLGLRYDDQTVKSLQSTVGLQASAAISTSYGVWVPQATADYVHEFENDQRSIDVQFTEDNRANPTTFSFNNDKPDRNFFNFGVGTVLVLSNGIQPFFNFRVLAGNNRFDNYAGTIGVRIEGS